MNKTIFHTVIAEQLQMYLNPIFKNHILHSFNKIIKMKKTELTLSGFKVLS